MIKRLYISLHTEAPNPRLTGVHRRNPDRPSFVGSYSLERAHPATVLQQRQTSK
jgi:hypothetical protein